MIVLGLGVVAGAAVFDVGLGADAEADQRRRIDPAAGGGDDLHGARQRVGDARRKRPEGAVRR